MHEIRKELKAIKSHSVDQEMRKLLKDNDLTTVDALKLSFQSFGATFAYLIEKELIEDFMKYMDNLPEVCRYSFGTMYCLTDEFNSKINTMGRVITEKQAHDGSFSYEEDKE